MARRRKQQSLPEQPPLEIPSVEVVPPELPAPQARVDEPAEPEPVDPIKGFHIGVEARVDELSRQVDKQFNEFNHWREQINFFLFKLGGFQPK